MLDYLYCFSSVDAGVGEDVAEAVGDADAASDKIAPSSADTSAPWCAALHSRSLSQNGATLQKRLIWKNSGHLCFNIKNW
jgi:hypothetical protein